MSKFQDMGMNALRLYRLAGVGEGLEEEREGVVVGKDGEFSHVGVEGEREERGVGVGEGSDERVENEDVGWFVELLGGVVEVEEVQEEWRLVTAGDQVAGESGVVKEVVEDELGLDLPDVGRRCAGV